ncbi:hypothetical protein C6500_00285 [Candidatus Poribacteria bacterium]|nr:MAG: hypothetical protein C6500_00285 [Candidatus Poribacteria bacterium]
MSVYEHEQGTYRSYRVARSIKGQLRQQYFPRTREGLSLAKQLDKEWAEEQVKARSLNTHRMDHWRKPKAPLSAQKRTKIANPAKIARLLQQIQNSNLTAQR